MNDRVAASHHSFYSTQDLDLEGKCVTIMSRTMVLANRLVTALIIAEQVTEIAAALMNNELLLLSGLNKVSAFY